LTREYSLREIAIMTRAGPARILGLADRGRLSPGALADIAVYRKQFDAEAMFRTPAHVFKSGIEVARDGTIAATPAGATQIVRPGYDAQIERSLRRFFDDHMTVGFSHFPLSEQEILDGGGRLAEHACGAAGATP
jgi:formylmethanofuran dehydrogenase subunit A